MRAAAAVRQRGMTHDRPTNDNGPVQAFLEALDGALHQDTVHEHAPVGGQVAVPKRLESIFVARSVPDLQVEFRIVFDEAGRGHVSHNSSIVLFGKLEVLQHSGLSPSKEKQGTQKRGAPTEKKDEISQRPEYTGSSSSS